MKYSKYIYKFGKRFVFVNTTPEDGSSSIKVSPENITLDNLSEVLAAMKGDKFTEEQFSAASDVFHYGNDADRQKLLKITKRLADGTYNAEDFIVRLPEVKKEEKPVQREGVVAPGEEPITKGAPELKTRNGSLQTYVRGSKPGTRGLQQ